MPDQLTLLIRAGNPLIEIESTDERRVREVVYQVAEQLSRPLYEWSVTAGLSCTDLSVNIESGSAQRRPDEEVRAVLDFVGHHTEPGVFLFHDLGAHGDDPWVRRKLRDLQGHCSQTRAVIVLAESNPLPPEIRRLGIRYEIGLTYPRGTRTDH